MTDSIRITRAGVSSPSSIASTVKAESKSKASAVVAPNVQVANLAAAVGPRQSRMRDDDSSTNLATSLVKLAGTEAFGPDFDFVKMTEQEALAAANAALQACNERLQKSNAKPQSHTLVPARAFRDEIGQTHVRLNRFFEGIPLFGEQAIAHFDDKGAVKDITASPLPGLLNMNTKPKITSQEAETIALKAVAEQAHETGKATSRLVIDKTDAGTFYLCHLVEVTLESGGSGNIFVNAEDGKIIEALSFFDKHGFVPDFKIKPATHASFAGVPAPANENAETLEQGEGNSLYLGKVKLVTTKEGERYSLKDSKSGTQTRDAQNGLGGAGSSNKLYTDNDNTWAAEGDPAGDKPAVDAHYDAVQFLAFLKEVFDRDSLDGKGLPLLSNVHVRRNYVNAYWDGVSMNYGDGDGRNAGPLVDKDVGSHEPTHGLTQHTSDLIYRNESGALNEAGSDIIGSVGFSWYLGGKNGSKPEYYWIGEDCWTPGTKGDALRYMDDPMKDREDGSDLYSRDNYKTRYQGSDDGGGVHLNSGIANNYFYLLAEGGTNRTSGMKVEAGIGIEKALRIYYRAHTVYFTPAETFAMARDKMIKAAGDLYGADSVEAKTVAQAWSAVGVESKPGATSALIA